MLMKMVLKLREELSIRKVGNGNKCVPATC